MFDFFESHLELILPKLLVEREHLVSQQLLKMKKLLNKKLYTTGSTKNQLHKWYPNNKYIWYPGHVFLMVQVLLHHPKVRVLRS